LIWHFNRPPNILLWSDKGNCDEMTGMTNPETRPPHELRSDIMLVVFLIALDVAARLLPHMPNFAPVAASALFAGTVLHHRSLALLVPLIALPVSDAVIGFDGWRITLLTYLASTIPAVVPMLSARLRKPGMFAPVMVFCSLLFFAVTNLGVWAFSGMYPLTFDGLVACYIAALPFLQHTVIGDLLWAVALFGGAWIVKKVAGRDLHRVTAVSTHG
jgi:hypothetical protein